MRNNSQLLWIVCALGLLTPCCHEDTNTPDPQVPGYSTDTCSDTGFVLCKGICIDPKNSNEYCGANANCEGYTICNNGQTCQNGKCIDHSEKLTDCNPPCKSNQTCQNGKCIDNSEQPQSCAQNQCGDWCGDFNTDSAHCGNCEMKCHSDEYCTNGHCESTAMCSQDKCDGWCGDLMNDPNHCGNCETDCTKIETSNGICKQGQCESNVLSCSETNQIDCNGTCIDPMNSNEYCGAGASCTGYQTCTVDEICQSGKCKPIECPYRDPVFNDNYTPGGSATNDKLFLLDLQDAVGPKSRFTSNNWASSGNSDDRRAMATPYVLNKNIPQFYISAFQAGSNAACSSCKIEGKYLVYEETSTCTVRWWLRSPGASSGEAWTVFLNGALSETNVDDGYNIGVRPALWVLY